MMQKQPMSYKRIKKQWIYENKSGSETNGGELKLLG